MSSRDLRLRVYVTSVAVLALGLLAATLRVRPLTFSVSLVALTIVATLSEILAVEFTSITFSITYAVCAATAILFGPAAGALVTGLATIPVSFTTDERRLLRGVFNFSQFILVGLAGGWAYLLSGGRLIAGAPLDAAEIPRTVLPLVLLTLASFAVNSSLVASVVSLTSGRHLFEVWKSSFTWIIPTESALTVLAIALAQVVASEGIVGLALFVVPLIIARQFYERYVTLRRTYADTVRSLVAVIDAKDAYTKGHSERVAAYSIGISRRLGFSDRQVERIELAALLHDLGKVAVSKKILLKKSRLNDEEYEAVKAHPDTGARIIEAVPFLADLIPFISGHHERVDGAGYGNHLSGEQIPLEARVLAVADAFDAMTSSRPYRAAMSREATVRELRRCAGQQFDEVIVEIFAEALANGAFLDGASAMEVPDEAV